MSPSINDDCTDRNMERNFDSSNGFVHESCPVPERAGDSVVANLEGTLLRSRDPFAYYLLLAMEAGSPLRALLLLLLYPVFWCVWHLFLNEALAYQILIFVSTAGLKFSVLAGVSRAVLTKFLLEDLHSESYRIFTSYGKRYVVTSNLRFMVEYSLKAHVGVDEVFGTELHVTRAGYCTGLISGPGILLSKGKADTVKKLFGDQGPALGLGNGESDYPFLTLCKEKVIVTSGKNVNSVPPDQYVSPLVFHDGRLLMRPTPISTLAIFLWFPFGLALAVIRIIITLCLPMEIAFPAAALSGVQIRVKGAPPLPLPNGQKQGILFACTHRSLLDPTFLCVGLRRKVRALTYSVSRFSELIAPMKTAYLTRDREEDARLIGELLEKEEDLFVCPEGTTGREPYLLRFSLLFAELTEHIVPVAMKLRTSMFHGTTARGYKSLDTIFLMMNPRPEYEVILLDRVPREWTVAGGKPAAEVAKFVQQQLADTLGYRCTNLTRKDKYTILAGHDGTVRDKRFLPKSSIINNVSVTSQSHSQELKEEKIDGRSSSCSALNHDR